jgi:hypothetical protein
VHPAGDGVFGKGDGGEDTQDGEDSANSRGAPMVDQPRFLARARRAYELDRVRVASQIGLLVLMLSVCCAPLTRAWLTLRDGGLVAVAGPGRH